MRNRGRGLVTGVAKEKLLKIRVEKGVSAAKYCVQSRRDHNEWVSRVNPLPLLNVKL